MDPQSPHLKKHQTRQPAAQQPKQTPLFRFSSRSTRTFQNTNNSTNWKATHISKKAHKPQSLYITSKQTSPIQIEKSNFFASGSRAGIEDIHIYKNIPKNIVYLPWRGNNVIIFFSSLEWKWRVITTCHGGIKQDPGRNKKQKGGGNQRKVPTTWEARAFSAASKLSPTCRVGTLSRRKWREKRSGPRRDKRGMS